MVVPFLQLVPYSIVLDSGHCPACGKVEPMIQPGESRVVNALPQCLFRAESAHRVEGVDYESFVVEAARVGQQEQYREPRPATELFARIRRLADLEEDDPRREQGVAVFNTCQSGLYITLRVKNVGAVPLRFAIRLDGMRAT